MSSLNDYVTVTITRDSVGVSRAGFGVMMVLSVNATFPERIRYYSDLPGVGLDFATSSPEYLAAQAAFSQTPHPELIAIGRGALPPTLVYQISVAQVLSSHGYKLEVSGQGVTSTEVTSTSDSSATNDEIVTDLVTQLNNVVGRNYTATLSGSPGSQVVLVTGNTAGAWFSISVEVLADLAIKATHADPGIATDLDAILLADKGWYALVTLYNSKAYVQAAAAWTEANGRIYVVDVNDTQAVTTAVGNGDVIDALHSSAYLRTMAAYHATPSEMMSAAWCGRTLPIEPGSETWKFKTLAGVSPDTLNTNQRKNLTDRKGNGYENLSGLNLTFEGTTTSGDFLDLTRGLDWLINDITIGALTAMATPDKLPLTDPGIAVLTAKLRASLKRGVARTILAADPEPTISAPLAIDISDADKAARTVSGIKFQATRAGAIHKSKIAGVVLL